PKAELVRGPVSDRNWWLRPANGIRPHQLDGHRSRAVRQRHFLHDFSEIASRKRHRYVANLLTGPFVVHPGDTIIFNVCIRPGLVEFMIESGHHVFPGLIERDNTVPAFRENSNRIVKSHSLDMDGAMKTTESFQ